MKKSINRLITVYFLIIVLLTVIISVVWNYYSTRQSILEMEMEEAEGCTKAVSGMLSHYKDALEQDPDSDEYTYLWKNGNLRCLQYKKSSSHWHTNIAVFK